MPVLVCSYSFSANISLHLLSSSVKSINDFCVWFVWFAVDVLSTSSWHTLYVLVCFNVYGLTTLTFLSPLPLLHQRGAAGHVKLLDQLFFLLLPRTSFSY